LVIRLSSLGDVVLTLPALDFIRRQAPEARVTFLTKPAYAGLVQGHPGIEQLWTMDTRGAHQGIRGSFNMARRIRAERFDAVLDLHANARARFFCLLSGAKSVHVKNYAMNRRLRAWFPGMTLPMPPDVSRRAVEAAATLLGVAPPPSESLVGRLSLDAKAKDWAELFLRRAGVKPGQKLVAIAPGAAWATKRWSAGYFAQTLGLLADGDKRRFVLVGAESDAALCGEILAYARKGADQALIAAGLTDAAQLAALIARCDVLLTNDSGPMHVASALGVPVVALFGPTVEAFGFFPRGARDKVFQLDLDCRPCSVHGTQRCPLGTHACMEGIAPFDVARDLSGVLNA
jgi:heptosyltransferase-2